MNAAKTHAAEKASVAEKPKHAVPGRETAEVNPFWQSLALGSLSIQTKLSMSQPDDPAEREADLVADRVMRMASPQLSETVSFGGVQRKCGPCEDEDEKLHRKHSHESDSATGAPPIVSEALRAAGHPLDPVTRSFMEDRFAEDFSQVRVHTDGRAAEAAHAVNALAYTVGHDVVFGAGQYATGNNDGRRLIAHELTHVVQQRSERTPATQLQRDVRDLPTATGPGNLLLFPDVAPTRVRIEQLGSLEGGLTNDLQRGRLSAIVASGMTVRGLAQSLLTFFTQAASTATATSPPVNNSPPTVDELAQAILVYNARFIPVPAMTNFTVGLRLPLPIEIDQTNGEFIVSPPSIRSLAARFVPAWTPLLDQAPGALATPTAAELTTAATNFLAQHATSLARGVALMASAMTNPFATVGLMTQVFQQLGTSAFDVAFDFMNNIVMHQINLLASLVPGDAILRLVRAALASPPANLAPDRETRRQSMLRALPVAPGWTPLIRADEAGVGGADRLADQTFTCGEFSVFVPAGARSSPRNQVHVFFSAGGAIGETSHVEHHGLRGAADPNGWILIGVQGAPGQRFTISQAQIENCLQSIGRAAHIDIVRLSAHSRGNGSMAAQLERRLITPSLIDHVTVLDGSDFINSLTSGFRLSRIPTSRITAYFVTTGPFPMAGVQSRGIDPECIRAIGYARLINDAVTTGRVTTLPPAIATVVGALPLPARGRFSTVTPLPAGMTSVTAFCADPANAAALRNLRRDERGAGHVSDLVRFAGTSPYAFVEVNNLLNINDPGAPLTQWRVVSPGIYSHHLFVAEMAHELFE
jgi:Domain of unknown function (DUF4157)